MSMRIQSIEAEVHKKGVTCPLQHSAQKAPVIDPGDEWVNLFGAWVQGKRWVVPSQVCIKSPMDTLNYWQVFLSAPFFQRFLLLLNRESASFLLLTWINHYGTLHDIPIIAVTPQYTSQKCSDCDTIVKKSLSIRTHICPNCGLVMDRDQNAALNILQKALSSDRNGTVGHTGTNELVS